MALAQRRMTRGDDSFTVGAGEVVTTPLLPGLAIDGAALFDR